MALKFGNNRMVDLKSRRHAKNKAQMLLRARLAHANRPKETDDLQERYVRRHLVNDFRTPQHGVNETSAEFDLRMAADQRARIDRNNRFNRERSASSHRKQQKE